MTGMDWRTQAACVGHDPEMWFPVPGDAADKAKRICRGCPVRRDCLFFALRHPTATRCGIWGGTSRTERDELRQWNRRVAS